MAPSSLTPKTTSTTWLQERRFEALTNLLLTTAWMLIWFIASLLNIFAVKISCNAQPSETAEKDTLVLVIVQMCINVVLTGSASQLMKFDQSLTGGEGRSGAGSNQGGGAVKGGAVSSAERVPSLDSGRGRRAASQPVLDMAKKKKDDDEVGEYEEYGSKRAACCACCFHCGERHGTNGKTQRNTRSHIMLVAAGFLRLAMMLCGTLGLRGLNVSFIEAVKSTAPIFTVVLSFCLLGERTSVSVMMSLVPIIAGLMLAAGSEASFNMIGFMFGIGMSGFECTMNVVCKPLCEVYGPLELLFVVSLTSTVLFLPMIGFAMESSYFTSPTKELWLPLLVAAIAFHLQNLSQFFVMERVSSVTLSVANVLKRGIIIISSLVYFQNPVSSLNILGMAVMFLGLMTYTATKQQETNSEGSNPPHQSEIGDSKDPGLKEKQPLLQVAGSPLSAV